MLQGVLAVDGLGVLDVASHRLGGHDSWSEVALVNEPAGQAAPIPAVLVSLLKELTPTARTPAWWVRCHRSLRGCYRRRYGLLLQRGVQLLRLSGHDEVIAVEATNLVRPPADRHPAPLFGHERRMMRLCLGQGPDLVRERQCLRKIREAEAPLQARDTVDLAERPVRHLGLELREFVHRHGRLTAPTRHTAQLDQRGHVLLPACRNSVARTEYTTGIRVTPW